MFTVIYSFRVKPGRENQFRTAWGQLTDMIYEYAGSLGSRLYHQTDTHYIACAQWPDKTSWENAGKKLPDSSRKVRQLMKDACDAIETLHELDMIDDRLRKITHPGGE